MELLVVCAEALGAVAVVLASLRITAALAGPDAWRGKPRVTGRRGSARPLGPDDDAEFLRGLTRRLKREDHAA